MSAIRNILPVSVRKEDVQILHETVADLFGLYTQIKQTHCNLRGQSFLSLPQPDSESGQKSWIRGLTGVHAASEEMMRVGIEQVTATADYGPADVLNDLLRDLDKQLWILEAQHLDH